PTAPPAAPLTFLAASVAYLHAGGDGRFLKPIIEATGAHAIRDRLVEHIDQIALDMAAAELYPKASAPTRNRQFYTPALAVLHHAGVDRRFKRPKGSRGDKSTSWLERDQAFALMRACYRIDHEFGLFCETLLYTGMRLGDLLGGKHKPPALLR